MKITQTGIDGVFTLHYEDRRMTIAPHDLDAPLLSESALFL
jgi:hypothetical protein